MPTPGRRWHRNCPSQSGFLIAVLITLAVTVVSDGGHGPPDR